MHIIENSLVDWFLSDAVLPPLVAAGAGLGVFATLGEGFHARFKVPLQQRLVHLLK